ncbi:MAG: exo-alpha-sialidase [Candidatus Margulisbacteria bacterium]|nr:exo-alpha-sialidase [Candidatus Margulisiibacteriota bacterium]
MLNKSTFLKVVGVLILIVSFTTAPSYANDISAIKLSQNNAIGARCLTRTPDKTIHLVYWNKEGSASKLYYINSQDEGGSWSPPFLLSQSYDDAKHACLATDENGQLYVFWADSGKILYSYTSTNGKNWSPIYKISGRLVQADFPGAIISKQGDIHIVFEDSGEIYYRMYVAQEKSWSTLFNLSQTTTLSKSPQISIASGEFLGVTWVENGEIAFREQIITPEGNSSGTSIQWNKQEIISREAENLFSLQSKANLNPQIIVDSKNRVHVIWGNGKNLIHRMRVQEFWSPAPALIAKNAMQWFGAATCTIDQEDSIYCAWIDDGKTMIRQYNAARTAWELSYSLPSLFQEGYHTVPVLGPAWSKEAFKPKQGLDLAYIRRTSLEGKDYHFKFYSKASMSASLTAPQITSVTHTQGRLSISWQPLQEQSAFRIIVGNASPVVTPYLYDSSIINDSLPNHLTKAFAFNVSELYIQVKVADKNGNWSDWSAPYRYKISLEQSKTGPEIILKGIEENSLYLYSPSPNLLYFGNGLDSPKVITIYGSVIGKSSGLKQISFSSYGVNTPPPLKDPETNNWEVQYSLQSADNSGEIIITATDYNENVSQARIQIIKDAIPPQPPTWVRINPDREAHDSFALKDGKKYNKNKVYIFWKDGSDQESGMRYHVMGTSNQWWKNSIHRSGDSEMGYEGQNTFYVFAVDNVGNISAPGTDAVFLDTVAPFAPQFKSQMTSTNIIYGIKSPDTVEVLVDGLANKVEIISSNDWKYLSDLKDGESNIYSLQAIDEVGNKSKISSANIRRKSTPPKINSLTHEPPGPFRGKDKIFFSLTGESGNLASIEIPGVAYDINLYDDGQNGDRKQNDGIYSGSFAIPENVQTAEANIIGILVDPADNQATQSDPKAIQINSSQPVVLDDFEILGDVFPWKNHVQVKNIDATTVPSIQHQGGGIGVCKIDYDFSGHQNWAGFSSREFMPRNCFGLEPYLYFKIKGSGSRTCRAAIKIRTKSNPDWNKYLKEFPPSEYTFSLSNSTWQYLEVPLPKEVAENLDEVVQYSIVLYSPDHKESGTFYLDNLQIVYKKTPSGTLVRKPSLPLVMPKDKQEISFQPETIEETMIYPAVAKGEFIPAPYLSPIFYPNPIRAGSPVRLKVEIPLKYKAQEVALLLLNNNGKLISTKLKNTNDTWWHGVAAMPVYISEGSYFGTLYIKTSTGHFLKTRFPFDVIPQQSQAAIDQLTTTFYPHPLVAGVGSTVKIKVPRSMQAKKIIIFFGESNSKSFITNLYIKNITGADEYWFGSVALPADLQGGDYTALIYVKNRQNQTFKKKVKYSVISN